MSESDHYDLVAPFVVVESKGGPYDDVSYCAGYQAGMFYSAAEHGSKPEGWVYLKNCPQLDLLAMKYDYDLMIDTDKTVEDPWIYVRFGHRDES